MALLLSAVVPFDLITIIAFWFLYCGRWKIFCTTPKNFVVPRFNKDVLFK